MDGASDKRFREVVEDERHGQSPHIPAIWDLAVEARILLDVEGHAGAVREQSMQQDSHAEPMG